MKSMTIRPARSRRRSCRATSSAASRLVLSAVSSMWCSRVERAGVDVDRHQRLGLVDHDVAAGAQLHGRREHRVELALDAHPREQRLAVAILPDRAHVRRHQHLHEIAGFLIAGFAGDLDFVDFLVVEVAQRTLDQRAFLVDQRRRLRVQGHVADGFPHPDQIFEVALDLGLGARGAGGAQDDAHALGHVEILHHFLQPRAVLRRGDLAADAAAARGIGHQHGIAAGQRQIGGQRGALVAALFLDDLHQHDLAALDDFLDLVLTARTEGALRHFFHDVVAADGFDDFFFGLLAIVFIIVLCSSPCASARLFGVLRGGSSRSRRGRRAARRRHGRRFRARARRAAARHGHVLHGQFVVACFMSFRAARPGYGRRLDRRRSRHIRMPFRRRSGRASVVIIGMFMLMGVSSWS